MTWFGLMSGEVGGHDSVCVSDGVRDHLFAKTPDAFFIKYLLAKASCKDFGLHVVDISVAFMHARTDDEIW